jgi:hypothetical protein
MLAYFQPLHSLEMVGSQLLNNLDCSGLPGVFEVLCVWLFMLKVCNDGYPTQEPWLYCKSPKVVFVGVDSILSVDL